MVDEIETQINNMLDEPLLGIVNRAKRRLADVIAFANYTGVADLDEWLAGGILPSLETRLLSADDVQALHECGRSLLTRLEWRLILGKVNQPKDTRCYKRRDAITPIAQSQLDDAHQAITRLQFDVTKLQLDLNEIQAIMRRRGFFIEQAVMENGVY